MTLLIQTKHRKITVDIGRALKNIGKAILTILTVISIWICAVMFACL